MDTREEIAAGLREVQQRLAGLTPRITSNLERPLLSGTWTVHDALCHIAADAEAVPNWLRRIGAAVEGGSVRPEGVSGEEFNEQQIEARKSLPVTAVLSEIDARFAADLAAIAALDESLLTREIDYRRGRAPAATMLRFYTGPHNMRHLDDIEQALDA